VKKEVIILAIGVLVIGGIFYFGKSGSSLNNHNATTTPIVVENKTKVVEIIKENSSTIYTNISLSYPKSSPAELAEVYKFVQDIKNEFLKEYGKLTKDQADKLYIKAEDPYEMTVTTKIETSAKTVSYIIQTYQYTGGAHGGTSVSTFTYDKEGKLVTLDNVLESNYLEVIASQARDYFYINLGEYKNQTMIDEGSKATKENYSAWYILDDEIVFIFGEYQVGPYVLGIQEFRIDKAKIQNILKPSYK